MEVEKKTLQERAFERVDVRQELILLERWMEDLRVAYEQHFTGSLPMAPDRQHEDVKRQIRKIRKAPFKNSQLAFHFKTLESRYNTYNTYWQRVLKERENGTYVKDVFKANLREKIAQEEARSQTSAGAASKHIKELFSSYKDALEKQSGKKLELNFDAFQKSLIQRAKDFKEQTGAKKLSFSVVVKNGKVTLQAKVKDSA